MNYIGSKLDFKKQVEREWIIANGIGGFSSSTILGINTRKYHGLLIAALDAPGNRNLILSKVDESLKIGEKIYPIYSNMCQDGSITDGYKYLDSFEKEYFPTYTYKIWDVLVKKTVCLKHDANTVCLLYHMENNTSKKVRLTLTPLLNFRDFHTVNKNHEFNTEYEICNDKLSIVIDKNKENPIYLKIEDAKFEEHKNDKFYGMEYIKERQRGFEDTENHAIIGSFHIDIEPNTVKDVSFVCGLEEDIVEKYSANEIIKEEKKRLDNEVKKIAKVLLKEDKKIVKDYVVASDLFIVKRKSNNLHTIIAGYPWFLDWGRDSLISFEGLLLISHRFDIAKQVLKTFTNNIKEGLVPNGYSEIDGTPLYNSADASLLLFEQVQKYIEYTNDIKFIENEIYPYLIQIIEKYKNGILLDGNNIILEDDFLISSGTKDIQNTWMDAKVDGKAVTPRNGKVVEINSMWYNALKIMEDITTKIKTKDEAKKYRQFAVRCQKSFVEKFYNKRKKCLEDVLGDNKIRPNQLYALSLTYKIIDPKSDMALSILDTAKDKLLTKYGLRTLAKNEEGYCSLYKGDSRQRDLIYHQGISWPWLLGLYYNSICAIEKAQKSKQKKLDLEAIKKELEESVKEDFLDQMENGNTVGNISEVYDSIKPYKAGGAFAQAWSIAEIFRIIFKTNK